jgi:serine phosphatase RsbU (regulator of sigma subunit)
MGEIGSPKLAVEHLRELSRFSSRLIQLADPKLRLESLCSLMLASQFHGQTGMAVRIAMDAAEHPQILCIRRAPGLPEQAPYISRSLLQAAIKHRQPLLAGNAGPAPLDVKLSVSPEVMPISVLACPIEISSENLDLLTVTMPPEFGTPEWLALAALAVEQFQHAETAWAMRKEAERHAAIDRELEHARAIQQQYLPRDLHVAGLDLAIEFRPSLWVGGDYVDVVPTPDGRVLLSIADVSGKGLHAALVASSLHAVLHVLAATQPDLPRLMREANGYLCRTLEMRSFVTMLCMLLDPQTGDFHCVNAGHPPALMLERGKFTALQSGVNMPLGIQSADYEAQRGCLARGQALAMFTDGLTELRNERDELLGIDHLGGCLASLHEPDLSAGEITRRLRTQLDEYQCSSLPVDDQTLLLTRRL